MDSDLQVRVNGIEVEKIILRRAMLHGYPDGPKEIAITDPVLGELAIDNSFVIEIREGQRWRSITAQELVTTVESIVGATH